ncbi:MAG TPA: DUF3857 domain-containing protein [Terriglobales bacterium]|nr:DUF3857 domain-containing protein [Terriglobales bacterium]
MLLCTWTRAQAPEQTLAEQEQAFASASDAVGRLMAVYRIEAIGQLLAPAELQACWTKLEATPGLDPLVGAEIGSQQALAELRAGEAAAAKAAWRRLGVVESWRAVGPFDNSSPGAIASAQGPGGGAGLGKIDFAGHYTGKQREVKWRRLPFTATLGELELGAYLSPSQSASAYLVSWVRSGKAQAVALRLRDSGATRVWVNGASVFEEQGSHASDGFDQHAVGSWLRAGWNQIIAKVGDGERSDWVFSLRVTTPAGLPLEMEATATPPAGWRAGGAAAPAAPAVRDLTALAQAGATSAGGKLAYAWVLNRKHNTNAGDHAAANAFVAALAAAPGDANAVLDFVEHDSDQSRRYQHLEELFQTPGSAGAGWRARAHLDRGTIELDRNEYWPARQDFWEALGQTGAAVGTAMAPRAAIAGNPLAGLGMLEAYAGMGMRPLVMAWAEALEGAGEQNAAIAPQVATVLQRMGAAAAGLAWLRVAHQQDAGNLGLSLQLTGAEREAGDLNEALATLRTARELDGEQPGLVEAEARGLSGLGRGPEAIATIQQAVALAPDAPGLRIAEGEIERHFGHAAAGLEAWQVALGLNPQDANLRDRLKLARGGETEVEASFERPYTQDLRRTIAAFAAEPAAERAAQESGPVVVLADTSVTNIFPSGNTGRYEQQIFRINNRQGADSLSVYSVTYDPATQEVRYLTAHVLHADGSSADAPEAGDQPISQSVGYETFYDVRNKYVEMPPMRAGDYVEIAYRVLPTTLESLYGDYFGDLDAFGSGAPTVFQQYVVITPANKPLYYKAIRFAGASAQHTAGGQTVYRWSARNLAAQVGEPAAPPMIEQQPYIAVSAFRTWGQFAQWYRQLIRDTFVMDDEMVQTVNRLVAGKTTEAAKVEAIYRWVIQNTHYVALEFGIHGYRPYPVTQVFHRRFGDCKDKASLLIAMLHQAGIASEFVLVRVRELGVIDPTIPSVADFDHAIVYVPSLHRYLDGTAEYNGADELPEGDQRAFVLRMAVGSDLAADGGRSGAAGADPAQAAVAPEVTAEQPASQNVSSKVLMGQLDAAGNLHFEMNWTVRGQEAPELRQALELPERRTGALQAMLHNRLPGISVTEATVENEENWDLPLEVSLQGEIPRFATVSGTTLLVPRQIVPRRWLPEMAALATRKTPVLMGAPEIQVEEMHLALPAGYQLARVPAGTRLEEPFGSFQAGVGMNGGTLTIQSRLETTHSLIAPSGYGAFRAFWTEVDATLGRALTANAAAAAPVAGGGQ